jgi:hypothetical protein
MLNSNVRDAVNFLANPPVFIGYQATAQSIANGTSTVITLDTVQRDTYSGWNASTNTYTIPVSGVWVFTGQVGWAANASGLRLAQLNGASYQVESRIAANAVAGWGTTAGFSGACYLTSGAALSLIGYQGSGGALQTAGVVSALSLRWVHA